MRHEQSGLRRSLNRAQACLGPMLAAVIGAALAAVLFFGWSGGFR